jgi:hypothetical protein
MAAYGRKAVALPRQRLIRAQYSVMTLSNSNIIGDPDRFLLDNPLMIRYTDAGS